MNTDIVEYLVENLEKTEAPFDWEVNWNKRQHVIELFVTIYAETSEDMVIEDVEGTVNEEEGIQFEDAICFYDPEKSKILLDDYLKAFPFSIKKGIEQGYLDAVLKILRLVVSEGQTNLNEFAQNPEIETFELNWQDGNFNQTIATLKDTKRYESKTLPYPKF